MKVKTYPGKKLTRDHIGMPGMVLQCTGGDEYTLRRKPIYPKGFSAMANALWKRESLELRKKWKDLISGGDPSRRPIWEFTIEIYRAVLYLRLVNNEYLHAGAPRRLPALQFDSFYGLPACNYATLSKPHKRQLRDRIALRRAELKCQADAKRAAKQTPTQPPIPIPLNSAYPSAARNLWQILTFRIAATPYPHPYTRIQSLHPVYQPSGPSSSDPPTNRTHPHLPP